MNDIPQPDAADPSASSAPDFARDRQRIDRRHWWVRAYSIFVILLLTFAIISLSLPAVLQGAETFFKIRISEAVFGLIALIVLFNVYTVYQEILIRRLRLQILEKQDHSDILRNLAMIDPLTGLYNRRYAEQRLAGEGSRSRRRGPSRPGLTLGPHHLQGINRTHCPPRG